MKPPSILPIFFHWTFYGREIQETNLCAEWEGVVKKILSPWVRNKGRVRYSGDLAAQIPDHFDGYMSQQSSITRNCLSYFEGIDK